MGGSVKNIGSTLGKVATVANPVGYLANKALYLGTNKAMGNNAPTGGFVGGLTQGGVGGNLGLAGPAGPTGSKGSPIYGYGLDPYGDQQQIMNMGDQNQSLNQALLDKNYASFGNDQGAIKQTSAEDLATRAAARDKLAGLLQDQARQTFASTLPGTAEDYNAGGLLNSSGYGNEVARQQAQLAAGITNQLGQAGLGDIDRGSQYEQQALQSKLDAEGYMRSGLTNNQSALEQSRQAALQRQFSVKDFGNAADTASIIGAQNAPQVGNGKAGTGALLGGAGSLATGIGGLK